MENLILDPTKYTPFVSLDVESNVLEINGRSCPENTFDFYAPVLAWLKEYFAVMNRNCTVNLFLPFCSSSSSKVLFDFFDILEHARENGHEITVNWRYEEGDEATLESGQEFQEDFEGLSLNLIPITDM